MVVDRADSQAESGSDERSPAFTLLASSPPAARGWQPPRWARPAALLPLYYVLQLPLLRARKSGDGP